MMAIPQSERKRRTTAVKNKTKLLDALAVREQEAWRVYLVTCRPASSTPSYRDTEASAWAVLQATRAQIQGERRALLA